jgi:hypothetical protein
MLDLNDEKGNVIEHSDKKLAFGFGNAMCYQPPFKMTST